MTNAASPIQEVRWDGQAVVVTAVGDIDLNSSADFQEKLLALLAKGPQHIVLNLRQVPYMDSSGVASLVKLLSRARRQGVSLRLSGLCERVRSIFEITRLDSVFEICSTEEEALA